MTGSRQATIGLIDRVLLDYAMSGDVAHRRG
jgi:hypothetical protein